MTKIRISSSDFHINVPSNSGIYRIISVDENDQPRHLHRVLGIDPLGILYIGKSQNLKSRVRMLWRVLQPNYKTSGHTFGMNYKSLQIIQDAFPYDGLIIEFEENLDSTNYEKVLLESYRQAYGEVPPLNGSK